MQVVKQWDHVKANIRTLEAALGSRAPEIHDKAKSLIEAGHNFVVYFSSTGVAFAPSRFIGYANNNIELHAQNCGDKNVTTNGGQTDSAIGDPHVLGRSPEVNRSAEECYQSFCRERGFKPHVRLRKFWVTDRVVGSADEAAIAEIWSDPTLPLTEKDQLIKARQGQGRFRSDLIELCERCCLTGCTAVEILRASHIKPWRKSNNHERLDQFNGFLLTPNADALFDKGYISFRDNGEMLVSERLDEEAASVLLAGCQRKVEIYDENKPYLEYHRNRWFPGEAAD